MAHQSDQSGASSRTRRWLDAHAAIAVEQRIPEAHVTRVVVGLRLHGYEVVETDRLAKLAVDAAMWRTSRPERVLSPEEPLGWNPGVSYDTGDRVRVPEHERAAYAPQSWWQRLLRRHRRVVAERVPAATYEAVERGNR